MKPLGMDKNRVLVYEGDVVLYNGRKYKPSESGLTGNLILTPYIVELLEVAPGTIGWVDDIVPGAVEVVNVSDRTNHERYFADLCSKDEVWKYVCAGVDCCDCIADDSICTTDAVLHTWLNEPAVKL